MISSNRIYLDAVYRITKRAEKEMTTGKNRTDRVIDLACEDNTDSEIETNSDVRNNPKIEMEEYDDHDISWTTLREEMFNAPDMTFNDDCLDYYESCAQSLCNVTNLILQDQQSSLQDEELDDFSNPLDVTILEKVVASCAPPPSDEHDTSSKRFMLNESDCENQPSTSAQTSKRRLGTQSRKTENLLSVSTEIAERSQSSKTQPSKRSAQFQNDDLLQDLSNFQHTSYSTPVGLFEKYQVSPGGTHNVYEIGKRDDADTQTSSNKSHRSKKKVINCSDYSEMSENDDPIQEQAGTVASISSKTAKHFNKKIMTERYTASPDLLSSPLRKMNLSSSYRKCPSERPCKTDRSRTKDKQIEIKCELNDVPISDCQHSEESESSTTQKMRHRKCQTERQQTSHLRRRSMQREEVGCQRSIEKAVSKTPTIHRNNYSLRSKVRSKTSQNDQANDQSETDASFLSEKAKCSSKKVAAYSPDTSPDRSKSFSGPRGKCQTDLPHKKAQSRTRGMEREFGMEENDKWIFECQQDEEIIVPLPPWRRDSPDTSPVRDPSILSRNRKCQSERPHKKVQSRIKSKRSQIEMKQDNEVFSDYQKDDEFVSESSNLLDVPRERYDVTGSASARKSNGLSKKANLSGERCTDSTDTSPAPSQDHQCRSERPYKKTKSRTKSNQSKIVMEQDDGLIFKRQQNEDLVSESSNLLDVPLERYNESGPSPSKKFRRFGNEAVDLSAEKGTDTGPVRNTSISNQHRKCQSERPQKKVQSRTKSKQSKIEMEQNDRLIFERQQDDDLVSESSKLLDAERCADSTDTSPAPSHHRQRRSERPYKKVQSQTKSKQIMTMMEKDNDLISDYQKDDDFVSESSNLLDVPSERYNVTGSTSARKSKRSSKKANLSVERCTDSIYTSPEPSRHRQCWSERPYNKTKSRTKSNQSKIVMEQDNGLIFERQQDKDLVSESSQILDVPHERYNVSGSYSSRKAKRSGNKAANLKSGIRTDSPDTSPVRDSSISSQHRKCQSERPQKKVQSRTKSKQSRIDMELDDELSEDEDLVSGFSKLLAVRLERYNVSDSTSTGKSKRWSKKVNLSAERCEVSTNTSPARDAGVSNQHRKCQSERPQKKVRSRTKSKKTESEVEGNDMPIPKLQSNTNMTSPFSTTLSAPTIEPLSDFFDDLID